MRQILLTSAGAVVARMPRPALEPGCVLVRTRFSLISAGTESASLQNVTHPPELSIANARQLLAKAVRDPAKAYRRATTLVRGRVRAYLPGADRPDAVPTGPLKWRPVGGAACTPSSDGVDIVTDDVDGGYQAMSQEIPLPDGALPVLELAGEVDGGAVVIGLLDELGSSWLGSAIVGPGRFDERLVYEARGSRRVTVVIANMAPARVHRLRLERVALETLAPSPTGEPASELDQQGWHVGYSLSGEVLAVADDVTDLVPGMLVACAGAGRANHADYVCVPRNLVVPVPVGCDLQWAATTTVGAIALQGVRRAAPQLGECVAVLGLGLIGQITAQLLRASGCQVLGLDPESVRVERARALGMAQGATASDAFLRLVREATSGRGADRTVITASSRSSEVVNLAIEATRRKGTVVIVGDVGLEVERPQFYRKELDLLMSTSYGPGRYDAAYEERGLDYPYEYVRWTLNRNMQAYLEQMASGTVDVATLVDRVVGVDDAPVAYRALAGPPHSRPLGVVLSYEDGHSRDGEPPDATRITIRGHRPVRQGPAKCAVVGAGAFAAGMLVPGIRRLTDHFQLRGVVSRDPVRGGNLARQVQAELLATDLDDVLADSGFDLVVIATRHRDHAPQVVRSLSAGKHAFVEKPLAITWEQLDEVVATYRSLADPPILAVGFNRRFSPAVRALAAALVGRTTPLVLTYRVNAGYIPSDSWVQGPEGGGRNIGEACHMYDVFRFLSGAPVRSIAADSIQPGRGPYLRTDNFSATLTYADGSVADLVYTALGPRKGLAKERLEVFTGEEAYVLDDYRELRRASDGAVLWQSADADKGHAEELRCLGEAVRTGEPPIPFDELVETTAVALHIDDLIRTGGSS